MNEKRLKKDNPICAYCHGKIRGKDLKESILKLVQGTVIWRHYHRDCFRIEGEVGKRNLVI